MAQTVNCLPAMRETRFNLWVGKISWRRKWQPTPVLLPGKSHGHRSLVGYSPWCRKESARLSDFTFSTHGDSPPDVHSTHPPTSNFPAGPARSPTHPAPCKAFVGPLPSHRQGCSVHTGYSLSLECSSRPQIFLRNTVPPTVPKRSRMPPIQVKAGLFQRIPSAEIHPAKPAGQRSPALEVRPLCRGPVCARPEHSRSEMKLKELWSPFLAFPRGQES